MKLIDAFLGVFGREQDVKTETGSNTYRCVLVDSRPDPDAVQVALQNVDVAYVAKNVPALEKMRKNMLELRPDFGLIYKMENTQAVIEYMKATFPGTVLFAVGFESSGCAHSFENGDLEPLNRLLNVNDWANLRKDLAEKARKRGGHS